MRWSRAIWKRSEVQLCAAYLAFVGATAPFLLRTEQEVGTQEVGGRHAAEQSSDVMWRPVEVSSQEIRADGNKASTDFIFDIRVLNIAGEPLRIRDVRSSCACTTILSASERLNHGDAGMVRGSVAASGGYHAGATIMISFVGEVTRKKTMMTVPISLRFEPTLRITSKVDAIPHTGSASGCDIGVVSIKNTSTDSVVVDIVAIGDACVKVSPNRLSIGAGATEVAKMLLTETRPIRGELLFSVNDGKERDRHAVNIGVEGQAAIIPQTLVLGAITMSETRAESRFQARLRLSGDVLRGNRVKVASQPALLSSPKLTVHDNSEVELEFELVSTKEDQKINEPIRIEVVANDGDVVQELVVPVIAFIKRSSLPVVD